MFIPYASDFEQNRIMSSNYTKFWAFWQKQKTNKTKQKNGAFMTIFGKALTQFWKPFL